jgi:hypothetical protein
MSLPRLLLPGLNELSVLHIDAPAGPSLTPSGPVLQEQQLTALQAQLPSLTVLPQQQQQQQQDGSASSGCSSSLPHVEQPQAVEGHVSGTAYAGTSGGCPTAQHAGSGLHCCTAGAPGAQLQLSCRLQAAATAAAAARPTAVIVFLSNTMGSTSYGVAQDASVHIIRGG